MSRTLVELLRERGIDCEAAWYEPYRESPRLSVPSFRLGTRRVGAERRDHPDASAGLAVGAWLPELEFTDYWPTRPWREAIGRADLFFVVSGNALPGLVFERSGLDHLAWLASDWEGDRRDRVASYPPPRRALDRLVVRPVARRMERRLLRRGRIVALSEATRRALDRAAGAPVVRGVVPSPIAIDDFRADGARVVPGRIGFLGRFDDPRKNLPLFLEVLARARAVRSDLEAEVIGGEAGEREAEMVSLRGLAGAVRFAELSREAYVERLATLEAVVVTSHQEGLGIAALEAMAAGCPVISTRCGGPEEFVHDGENGFLCGFDAEQIARRLLEVVGNRPLRDRMGSEARRTVETGYTLPVVRAQLGREIDAYVEAAAAASGRSPVGRAG